MRLSELMGREVVDESGVALGEVKDLRFSASGPAVPLTGQPSWRLSGLVVGGAGYAQRLGYLHGDVRGPRLLATIVRRIGRRGYLVPWDRVSEMSLDRIEVCGTAADLEHPYFDGDEAT